MNPASERTAIHWPIVGILVGFAPWIVYWVLVGNVPFAVAVLVALAIAVAAFAIVRGEAGHPLEIGAVVTFLVLTALTFACSEYFLQRWILPLSNAGIFAVALAGLLIGTPFVGDYPGAGRRADVVESELFGRITAVLTGKSPR